MYVDHNTNPLSVYLYKHTKSSGAVTQSVTRSASGLSMNVSPNPFRSNPVVSLTGMGAKARISIYTVNGKLVTGFGCSGKSFILNSTGLCNGIYLIKAVSGNETVQEKILLQR